MSLDAGLPIGLAAGLLGIGLVLGAVIGWLASGRRRTRMAAEYAAQVRDLTGRLDKNGAEFDALRADYLKVHGERAAALGKLEQVEALENRIARQEEQIESLNAALREKSREEAVLKTALEKDRQASLEKLQQLEDVRAGLRESFQALSASALRQNNESFLDLARTTLAEYQSGARQDLDMRGQAVQSMIAPLKEALDKYESHLQSLERARESAYGGLAEQVRSLNETQQVLSRETGKLVKALRVPHVRGRWGEMTLRRVAELTGMQNHCDFCEQATVQSTEGLLRPDMVVELPGDRRLVVDAKVPIAAYLDALEATDEAQQALHLAAHARQVMSHVQKLSQKAYWAQFQPAPEFVVLFIPGENFFAAALSQQPSLIEDGASRGVMLATPTTLISLLKTVAFIWRQETAAQNSRQIWNLGRELYERLFVMAGHMNRLGRDIERCAGTYNQVIGSLEARVLVSARKFQDLGLELKENQTIEPLAPVEEKPRQVKSEPDHELQN